jgi:hypothetical protein
MTSAIVYPSLKQAADAASALSQRRFLALIIAQLWILVLTAVTSGWTPADPAFQRGVAIVVAILMFIALGIATTLRLAKFDDRWFRCRALAENIKSGVWFFVMSPAISVAEAEAAYLAEVDQVQKRLEQVAKEVALHDVGGPLITGWMRETQRLPLDEKVRLYREKRLEDQRGWYLNRSQYNTRREAWWFGGVFVIEFAAVAYAALQAWRLWQFNAVGAMAAMSVGLIAWMQTKRFSDLALSYGIAAGDLRRIAAEREHVATEEDLENLVKDVETAVSREHSLWLARRTC